MFDLLPFILIVLAIGLLITLSLIDLKHWILPDELNFALGLCGVAFHVLTAQQILSYQDIALGAALGAGFLYVIRFFSNRHYGRDTLGLGDVKLLGAAGLWLGVEGVLMAVTLGAFAGLLHGLVYAAYVSYKNKTPYSIKQLMIPAGPGFAVGIAISGFYLFGPYVIQTLHDIIP